MIPPSGTPQTDFTTAPAGISPLLIYLERAMSSLRASATIEMRRIRPRLDPTRWRNQQLRALAGWYLTHIQASSTIVVRRRGLPAFEIPCSWPRPAAQGPKVRMTLSWRGLDSNFQYAGAMASAH